MALFRRLCLVTIAAVYILILIGGIVRSTGAGMGCPDWPRCFGQWVPPVDESALPDDYAEKLTEERKRKNTRVLNLLSSLGISHNIDSTDHAIYENIYFNVSKAWIEYVNRVIGVIIGFLITLTFGLSFKHKNSITFLCGVAFVLVVFQGWLGSYVVSTNLLPGLITLHMIVAMLIVILLIAAYYKSLSRPSRTTSSGTAYIQYLLYALLVLSFVQVVVGTQVREEIDVISRSFQHTDRHLWISSLGSLFTLHIALSVMLFVGHLLLYLLANKIIPLFKALFGVLFLLVSAEIIFGAILGLFHLPAFAQPVHLLFGTLIIGGQFYLILLTREVYLHKHA